MYVRKPSDDLINAVYTKIRHWIVVGIELDQRFAWIFCFCAGYPDIITILSKQIYHRWRKDRKHGSYECGVSMKSMPVAIHIYYFDSSDSSANWFHQTTRLCHSPVGTQQARRAAERTLRTMGDVVQRFRDGSSWFCMICSLAFTIGLESRKKIDRVLESSIKIIESRRRTRWRYLTLKIAALSHTPTVPL